MSEQAEQSAESARGNSPVFATTHWSVVLSAGQTNSSHASEALEKLCRAYWPPLYSYVRRQGQGPEEAQDLTQAFFAKLLQKNFWARADPQKGRFRSFLLTALRHFLADERDRGRTAKRGGGLSFISLDEKATEERYLEGLGQNLSGEQQFDRQWAATVLEQARAKLREECVADHKGDLFGKVESLLSGEKGEASYADVAAALKMSEGAIKVAVHRLRQRYGELVRAEIAHTVATPEEADEELHYLFSVLRD